MTVIRPKDLPVVTAPTAGDVLIIDGATVRSITVANLFTNATFVTPTLGAAAATSINKVAITAPAASATLTIPDGVTLTGPAASGTVMTLGNVETITGAKTFGAAGNVGKLAVAGTTSGSTILNASAIASGTLTLPAATDTLVGKATTDVLTNKTFDTAGTGNVFKINGVAISANTGTGSNVLATSPALVTPALGVATATSINGSTVSPGHYTGEPSTGNAVTGEIGEYIETSVPTGSAVSLVTATAKTIATLAVPAGDWDVDLNGFFNAGGGGEIVTSITVSVSLVTNTLDATVGRLGQQVFSLTNPPTLNASIPPLRFSFSTPTNVFFTAQSGFSGGGNTQAAWGIIRARRAR